MAGERRRCKIYAALINGGLAGICDCGYGLQCMREEDASEMFSEEYKRRLRTEGKASKSVAELIEKLRNGE